MGRKKTGESLSPFSRGKDKELYLQSKCLNLRYKERVLEQGGEEYLNEELRSDLRRNDLNGKKD
jgi:hypothetical protein